MLRLPRATVCLFSALILLALFAANAPLVLAARAHRSFGDDTVAVDTAVDDTPTDSSTPTDAAEQDGSSEMLNIAHEFDAQSSAATDAGSGGDGDSDNAAAEYGSVLLESSSTSTSTGAGADAAAHTVGHRADAYTVSDATSAEDAAVIHRAHRIGIALNGRETADEIRRKELAIAANIANGKKVQYQRSCQCFQFIIFGCCRV
jgi:hypothetical protein